MNHYQVKVSTYDPYPKEWEKRIGASSFATAVARAIRELRKGPIKGRRIDELTIKIKKL